MNIPNQHVLIVKTLGPTNTQLARVKIQSERFKQSVIIPFNNEINSASPTIETATKWLTIKGFSLLAKGEGSDHYYIISNTFKPLKN